MAETMTDDDLQELLPDYLNNALAPEMRRQVDAYLARSPQARVNLDNLQRILSEMDRLEDGAPTPDEEGRRRFLAYAAANPLAPSARRPRWRWKWDSAAWIKPAFAMAAVVVLGQGVFIGHLLQKGDEKPGESSRSLNPDSAEPRARGPILSVQVAPDAPFADVVAAIRDVQGRIISGPGESTMLFVELSGVSAEEGIHRLKKSGLVLSVIEVPTRQAVR
jgi:hypothetical protein